MDWPAFFGALGDFIMRMLGVGWWMVAVLAGCALFWRFLKSVESAGWPWQKKKGE